MTPSGGALSLRHSGAPAAALLRLYAGLGALGLSIAAMIRARIGLAPWDVLQQGISERTGLQFGWVVILVGVLVLLAWLPLRQRPGLGTVSNVLLVGLVVNVGLDVLPVVDSLALRIALFAAGLLVKAAAIALYLGAGMGPGPRDGLMTGLAARGHSIRLVRSGIELAALGVGWLLGGGVGAGTVVHALLIGPLLHYFIPRLRPATNLST